MYCKQVSNTQLEATQQIVRAMCEAGHMHGWFGDTSDNFQDEEVESLLNMRKADRIVWLDNNASNLIRDCGIKHDTILACAG